MRGSERERKGKGGRQQERAPAIGPAVVHGVAGEDTAREKEGRRRTEECEEAERKERKKEMAGSRRERRGE